MAVDPNAVAAGKVGYRTVNSETDPSGTKGFEEETLTYREHNDPDKHWIGESLAEPSLQDTASAGQTTFPGTSNIVARSDHSHDTNLYRGIFTGNSVVCAPGTSYLNGWVFNSGNNILAPSSTQTFLLPAEGLWEITVHLYIERSSGGVFTNEYTLISVINGGFNFFNSRQSLFDIPGFYVLSDTQQHRLALNDTIQFRYDHNDSSNHSIQSQNLSIIRLGQS